MKINRANLTNATKKTYLQYIKLFPVLQKQRTKQYGMLIFTFATMTFFGIFAINPTLTTIVTLQRSLEDAQFAHEQLTAKIANLSALQNQYTSLGPDLVSIEDALPPTVNATTFMGQLQTIITSSGVSVDGVSYGALVLSSKQPVNEGDFSFALQARGTYTQINTFLTSLTSFNRIVVIDSLSITKESVGGSLVNVALDGTAHYKK